MDVERKNGNSSDKPKFEGEWECSQCQKPITELPFQPREGQEVSCRECYSTSKRPRRSDDRPKVQGNWQCAGCGKEITELPFNPREGSQVYCHDCYRSNRPSR